MVIVSHVPFSSVIRAVGKGWECPVEQSNHHAIVIIGQYCGAQGIYGPSGLSVKVRNAASAVLLSLQVTARSSQYHLDMPGDVLEAIRNVGKIPNFVADEERCFQLLDISAMAHDLTYIGLGVVPGRRLALGFPRGLSLFRGIFSVPTRSLALADCDAAWAR